MKRETLLEKGYTEEQVTDILNTFHGINKENEKLKSDLLEKADFEAKYNEVQSKLDKINEENLTAQEKIELNLKQAEADRKQARIELNTTKAKNILANYEVSDELVATLVSEDESVTIKNATALKNKFDAFKDTVEKQTKESIQNLDVKPNPTNVPQGEDVMTWDKYVNMSQEEQNKYATEHPQEFSNL